MNFMNQDYLVGRYLASQGGEALTRVFLDGSEKNVEVSSLGWDVSFQYMMVVYPYLEQRAIIKANTDQGVHQMKEIIGKMMKPLTT